MHVLTRVIKKIPQNDVDSVVTPANNPEIGCLQPTVVIMG